MSDKIFGGIEGGGTHSMVAIFDGSGKKLVECQGPDCNHWLIGMEECQNRINSMVQDAKKKAGLSDTVTLEGLGLSLSGCEQVESNEELRKGIIARYPKLTRHCVVASDTVGSLMTATENGGIVLIAGTGSNALLVNKDGTQARCGGWSYILGDEAAAWWIAHKGMKICFDEFDNLEKPPYPSNYVWEAIREHFQVKDRFALLEHCYTKFEKSHFAGVCQKYAIGADKGDELCRWLFAEAGRWIVRYILAVIPSASKELLSAPGGVLVVCVGSVWKSWEHLRPGFLKELELKHKLYPQLREISLVRLTSSMAIGATYLGAKAANFDLPRKYEQNYNLFFQYRPGENGVSVGS